MGDGPATAHVPYGIRYTVGADAYDDREASAALRRCAELPGASLAGQDDSLPPQASVRFQGAFTEQDRLEACLRDLPDAEVSEPRPIPPDQR